MISTSLRTRKEYARRINSALELIEAGLDGEINLGTLAAAAHFSPFHFHRIFSALVGEAPAEYVRRLRLEKAAGRLSSDPHATVTEVALASGFSTSALFARLFRARFGMSPTAWRRGGFKKSKNGQTKRKKGKDGRLRTGYKGRDESFNRERRWTMKTKPVIAIRDIPPLRVAYVKHMKGYEDGEGIGNAFRTLMCWAGPRGVVSPDMKVLGLSLDNPEITPKDKCRYYACVTVDERAEPEGEVGVMILRPGRYAVGHFEGGQGIFKLAYAYMYGEWLPGSGYQPDDAPCFESYDAEPESAGRTRRFAFDLYIPVKPL